MKPFAIVLVVLASAAALGAAELRVKPRCAPRGAVVTLGDLVEVTAAEPRQIETLAALELFPAPLPGQARLVRVRELQDLLAARQVNLVEHRFTGASETLVAVGERAVEASAPRPPAAAGLTVVAVAPIAKNAVIQAADVRAEALEGPAAVAAAYDDVEEVVGKQATRAIAAGAPIAAGAVRAPRLVRRGELIAVRVEGAGVRVRATARALDDGGLGDVIAVEAPLGRTKLLARIVGPNEAAVETPPPSTERATR